THCWCVHRALENSPSVIDVGHLIWIDHNANGIETTPQPPLVCAPSPCVGEAVDAPGLIRIDCTEGRAAAQGTPRLDIAEHDGRSVLGDDVEFADGAGPVAIENAHAVATQMGHG